MLRLLDSDSDGSVTRSELYSLHFMAVEYATRKKCSMPEDLATLINALYLGFNRQQLRAQLELKKAAGRDLQAVEAALNVRRFSSLNMHEPLLRLQPLPSVSMGRVAWVSALQAPHALIGQMMVKSSEYLNARVPICCRRYQGKGYRTPGKS